MHHYVACLSVQFSLVAQSCPTVCNPMDCSTPSLTVHHQLLEFTQTYVHQVGDRLSNHLILFHPFLLLSSIFPSISLFQWVSSLHQVAKVSALQFQYQSFQWIFRVDFPLGLTGLISSPSKGLLRTSPEQFKSINSLALSLLYSCIHTWLLEKS